MDDLRSPAWVTRVASEVGGVRVQVTLSAVPCRISTGSVISGNSPFSLSSARTQFRDGLGGLDLVRDEGIGARERTLRSRDAASPIRGDRSPSHSRYVPRVIALTDADFDRLSTAFFAEMIRTFGK